MQTAQDLRRILSRIDGRGYKAYKEIRGGYQFEDFNLTIDYVQGDPFAAPSRFRAVVSQRKALFPPELFANRSREVGLRDYVMRKFALNAQKYSFTVKGSGKSGLIAIDQPNQEILERTGVLVNDECVEARFMVGLPAAGRTVLGHQAINMIFSQIPRIVESTLFFKSHNSIELTAHVNLNEDQDYLRNQLTLHNLIAFIPNGAILPRASGVDNKPMTEGVIPFQTAPNLENNFILPHQGEIAGMGIPKGITLIVGGGYHGKSTLLNAIELGVYNHTPGDGRELVVTNPDAVKIRAEDGRSITSVNISPFINNLPLHKDTTRFCTPDASGSTSQAANIIEALETGAEVLLIDEDTSATNFMIRDGRMQELVSTEKEPITPFIDKARQLYTEKGVSSLIVIGGAGDYFDIADTVIMLDNYLPYEVTSRAKEIARKHIQERKSEGGKNFGDITARRIITHSINPSCGRKEVKINAKNKHSILYGTNSIDLSAVEQIVEIGQTRAIGQIIYMLTQKYMNKQLTLPEALEMLEDDLSENGLKLICSKFEGCYALPRRFEVAAAINHIRGLKIA